MKTRPARSIKPQTTGEDRFLIARSHLKNVGIILSLYSSVIRAIQSAPTILKTQSSAAINSFAVSSALLPIRISPTLTESLQIAASEFYPKEYKALRESGNAELKNVLKLFNANEIASVLGITYFYKLLNKCCDPQEFTRIAPILSVQLRLGALVGSQTGDRFGRGGGLAATGIRILALAVFIKADLKAFKKYRRLIDDSGQLNHSKFEIENFGCTHLDIASILAGDLGFGSVAREAYITLQNGGAQPSTPDGIFWNHTLTEASHIWSERQDPKVKNLYKTSSQSLDLLDGYKWLWGQSSSEDVLPGIEIEEITSLIPEQSAQTNVSPENIVEKEPTTDLSVLIVEDDLTSARILEKYLSPLGYITIKESAESAMALITAPMQSLPFDVVLLDVGLPGKSGLSLLNSLREIENNLSIPEEARCKVFMITGDDTPKTVIQAFSQGANGYLTKPLNKDEMKAELAKHDIILAPNKEKLDQQK